MGRVAAFLERRPALVRGHLAHYFGLGDTVAVTVRKSGGGTVRLNSLSLPDSAWTGTYLAGLEIELEAVPDADAEFMGWSGGTEGPDRNPRRTVHLEGPREFRAEFRPRSGTVGAR
jgi:hypothetical protein